MVITTLLLHHLIDGPRNIGEPHEAQLLFYRSILRGSNKLSCSHCNKYIEALRNKFYGPIKCIGV